MVVTVFIKNQSDAQAVFECIDIAFPYIIFKEDASFVKDSKYEKYSVSFLLFETKSIGLFWFVLIDWLLVSRWK